MDTLRSKKIFNNATLTIVAIERVNSRHIKTNAGYQFYGDIKPIAVIVCDRDSTYVLDMNAKRITIDQLLQNAPELDAIIAPYQKT